MKGGQVQGAVLFSTISKLAYDMGEIQKSNHFTWLEVPGWAMGMSCIGNIYFLLPRGGTVQYSTVQYTWSMEELDMLVAYWPELKRYCTVYTALHITLQQLLECYGNHTNPMR